MIPDLVIQVGYSPQCSDLQDPDLDIFGYWFSHQRVGTGHAEIISLFLVRLTVNRWYSFTNLDRVDFSCGVQAIFLYMEVDIRISRPILDTCFFSSSLDRQINISSSRACYYLKGRYRLLNIVILLSISLFSTTIYLHLNGHLTFRLQELKPTLS